jgi:hypothetical protein
LLAADLRDYGRNTLRSRRPTVLARAAAASTGRQRIGQASSRPRCRKLSGSKVGSVSQSDLRTVAYDSGLDEWPRCVYRVCRYTDMVVRSEGKRGAAGAGRAGELLVWQLVDATYGYLLAVGSVSERRGQSGRRFVHQPDLRQSLSVKLRAGYTLPTQVPS